MNHVANSFKSLSQVDKRSKYGVYGWIRRAEKELQSSNIPEGIYSLIILYYAEIDKFEYVMEGIETSSNMRQVTKIARDESMAESPIYGKVEIQSTGSGIYEWELKVHKTSGWINIGISSWIATDFREWLQTKGGYYYGIYSTEESKFIKKTFTLDNFWDSEAFETKAICNGDTVAISYDVNEKKLEFVVMNEGQNAHFMFENIESKKDIQYRLIIVLVNENDCVEMTRFSHH